MPFTMFAPSLQKSNWMFFSYQVTIAGLAAAASSTQNIAIDAGSKFLLQKITYMADISAAAQTDSTRVIPLISVQITDSGSGQNLFNQSVPVPSISGTGELPFVMPNPQLFEANSNITLVFLNYSASTTYNLYFTLHGQKIFSNS